MSFVPSGALFLKVHALGTKGTDVNAYGGFREDEIAHYIREITLGLKYLHDKLIIHRDLKLANILLENYNNKSGDHDKLGHHEPSWKRPIICDFGFAIQLDDPGDLQCGIRSTPNYVSPEMISDEFYSFPIDIWALGVITYALLQGKCPFETDSMSLTYRRIKECVYYFPARNVISDDIRDFIRKILIREPEKRLTAAQLLEHPFLKVKNGREDQE